MFENVTEEMVMERMLDRVPDTVQGKAIDKSEGSIIYDALAPAAQEIMILYGSLDLVIDNAFADTASREYLIRRAAERDISPYPATNAIWRGEFNIDVPIGSRYSIDDLDYVVIKQISEGVFEVRCEMAGSIGNTLSGDLIPIDYIDGLTSAQLVSIIAPGEDEEDTAAFRERYFMSVEVQAFGGNIADYKEKIHTIPGVGGVKIYPVWDGGGTVKAVITDANNAVPDEQLISDVQNIIDPTQDHGGLGLAPIGHVVTIAGALQTLINIVTTLEYDTGYNWSNVGTDVLAIVDQYYQELCAQWETLDYIIVRISQLESRILTVTGVADISDTTLNGNAANLELNADNLPKRGTFNGS
jgi:uncharacterized phage protein gp47/JayE